MRHLKRNFIQNDFLFILKMYIVLIQVRFLFFFLRPTWGRKCFQQLRSPASEHPSPPFDLNYQLCE